ncbi:hypothetical protein N7478_012513 [Penicillium angulare]|uniref:uncharacterized protein n=1 Tax=Penicillium angulare TaxID=116970 RepID=UPI0025420FAA|nr:uncharacterized protein N7478_012513 [Penicillium angulare]KAJ5259532.1 hypothetical protein N7478_012513 [Penicillium angulare]
MATLKPPPAQHRSSSSSHTSTGPPKAPLKADPSSTIADTAVFQGTYPVTIGANTIIHPRARFYAYEGPIYIGDGCIISEKATIGAAPTKSRSRSRSPSPSPSSSTSPSPSQSGESTPTESQNQPTQELTTRLSYFVIIGPQTTVLPGAHIHSSTHVEALCIIHRRADVGSHVKICSGCEVPESGSVPEWMVVWGSGLGQRRRRVKEAKMPGLAVLVASQVALNPVPGAAPEGKVIEDARLMVLQKEREALARMIVPAGVVRKK